MVACGGICVGSGKFRAGDSGQNYTIERLSRMDNGLNAGGLNRSGERMPALCLNGGRRV